MHSTVTEMLNENEAAQRLGIAVATLRTWRSTKRVNLAYYKLGNKAVRYKASDLDAFLNSRRIGGAE